MINSESHLCVSKCLPRLNFNCGFNLIWPDRKFNGKTKGTCCKLTGATTIKFWIILSRYVKGLCVSLPKVIYTTSFGLTV